jgi:formylglycine-generating enzyme required for sulfatase activity
VQVNSANLTITGSGTAGVFVNNRNVTLTPYKIAKYETTWQLWKEVYDWAVSTDRGGKQYTFANAGQEGGTNGGTSGDNQPVARISWRDAIVWCNAYSEISGLTPVYYTDSTYDPVLRISTNDSGTATAADTAVIKASANGYRLPTEAQWECAARGGNPTDTTNWAYAFAGAGSSFSDAAALATVAWGPSNADSVTHEAGTKSSNRLGLHDMSGNLSEWIWDWYTVSLGTGNITNPPGPNTGTARVSRGGAYNSYSADALTVSYRSGARAPATPRVDTGFRLAQ